MQPSTYMLIHLCINHLFALGDSQGHHFKEVAELFDQGFKRAFSWIHQFFWKSNMLFRLATSAA